MLGVGQPFFASLSQSPAESAGCSSSQSVAEVPEDLQAALDADPGAAEFFATLDRTNRYAVLYRVHEAKRADTRARRIEKFVAMLHAHETLHPRPAKSTKPEQ